ncbi:unnamed protein product [Cylicocyclus nassatus]|uniref:FHA domain-containing protein n=1 Tax=Cylicocyclus nassatus TaxID=53992 RepID=A0AA36GS49_CYLNA|nr:unnamed protein product [Cylicocyclus nassatus]
MAESSTVEAFKAPPLPLHKELKHLDDGSVEIPAAIMPVEEEPHSPVERAAAESKISISHPALHYTAPPWASVPDPGLGYRLEIVKNGAIVDTIDLDNRKHETFVLIGRLPNCDVVLDHPSISRYHCVLQYGEDPMDKSGKGWHIYDMGSTHGSKANKNKIPPKQYMRIRVGFVLQFGGSTRLLSLLGPSTDCEPEWDYSPTEMKEKMHKKALEAKLAAAAKKEFEEEKAREAEKSEGIDWGMNYGEDDEPAPDIELDPHLMEDREQYYRADPKKALAKFFEREGFDMEFQLTEQGSGHTHKWLCSIELPIEVNGIDRAVTAQATVSTSKKDAQVQCALEACRILDAHGVLRRSTNKSRAKNKELEANDFYDEDDDEYLDRTGQIEKQREKRMMWAKNQPGGKVEKKSTYESLCKELEETRAEIANLKKMLDDLNTVKATQSTGDSLDDYCRTLNQGADLKSKTEISMLRQKLVGLTHDAQRLEKLVKIAKPVALPELKVAGANVSGADKQAFLRKMMMLGRKRAADEKAAEKEEKEKEVKGPASIPAHMEKFKPEMEDEEEEPASDEKPTSSVSSAETTEQAPSSSSPHVEEEKNQPEQPVVDSTTEDKPAAATPNPVSMRLTKPGNAEPVKTKQQIVHDIVYGDDDKRTNVPRRSLSTDADEDEEGGGPKKKRRVRVRPNRPTTLTPGGDYGDGMDDDKYATWLPPENQSGDGKTALNEKFAGRY